MWTSPIIMISHADIYEGKVQYENFLLFIFF